MTEFLFKQKLNINHMIFGLYDITPYLHLPELITVLIIPYVMYVISVKLLLDELKIFSSWVHLGLACVIGAFSIPLIVRLSFIITRACGFSYGPLKVGLNVKGIIVGAVSMGITWIVLPIISSFIPTMYF